MKTYDLGILIFDGCYLSSLSGPIDAFQIANAHLKNQFGESANLLSSKIIGLNAEPVMASGGIAITPQSDIHEKASYRVVYVPGFHYCGFEDFKRKIQHLSTALTWLKSQWNNGSLIATSCTGSFIVGASGLLDGNEATTSWWLEAQFRKNYPAVKLNTKAILTEENNIVCAGAMTAMNNLSVYLIEKLVSYDLALICAKDMLVDMSQISQSPYQKLILEDLSIDPKIAKAQQVLQNQFKKNIDLSELARSIGMSQKTLIQRFKAQTGMTPSNYLQNCRIETAKSLLESTGLTVFETMEQVGYGDLSSFSKLFKLKTGLTPSQYRLKFSNAKQAANV